MKNLAYVVSIVQMDLEDYSSHSKKKYCQYAAMAYRNLNLHGDNRVKTTYVTPNDVFKAFLPNDFMFHTKVGVNYRGEWITLSINQNLFTKTPQSCGDDVIQMIDPTTLSPSDERFYYIPHWRSGNFVGEMYSIGGGYSELGGFKIDHHNNIINFDPRFPKLEYALEYASDGSDADGSTLIPTGAVEPIRCEIKYEIENNKRGKNRDQNLVNDLWGDMNKARQTYRDMLYLPSIEEWCDISYEQYSGIVKR